MELKRAKEVLDDIALEMTESIFLAGNPNRQSKPFVQAFGDGSAILHGEFNPDQLIAIATWMRNPEGVVKA